MWPFRQNSVPLIRFSHYAEIVQYLPNFGVSDMPLAATRFSKCATKATTSALRFGSPTDATSAATSPEPFRLC